LIRVEALRRSPEIDSLGRGNLEALVDGRGLTVHGWALGTGREATAVEVSAAGEELVRMPLAISRPDVVEQVGDLPGAVDSGFAATLRPLAPGRSRVDLRVHFDDDSSATLGEIELEAEEEDVESGEGDGGCWAYFQSPAEVSNVRVGRDGWLFLRGDNNDATGQHTGRVRFSEADRQELSRLLAGRVSAAADAEAVWLTAIIPDKEILYSERLPADIAPVARRPVHDFLDLAAESGANTLYMLEALRDRKSGGDLYMRTDTHWNFYGAYIAYRSICAELGRLGLTVPVVDETWIEWWEEPFEGDLGGKLPHPTGGTRTRANLTRSWGRRVYDNAVRNHGRVMIHEQDRAKRPSCLVFGESFGETLLYFLKESFGRVVFAHTSMFVGELIEQERPEVILSLPIERFLIRIPDDADALARLARTAREKGGELPWDPRPQA
jgi:hypothetical protein